MFKLLYDLRIGNNIGTKSETIIMNIINILIANGRIIVCITKLFVNIVLSLKQIFMKYSIIYYKHDMKSNV